MTEIWKKAIEKKKLRLFWRCEQPSPDVVDYLISFLYTEARKRRHAPEISQDESILFLTQTVVENGLSYGIQYTFDYDFCSMYDKADLEEVVLFYDSRTSTAHITSWE